MNNIESIISLVSSGRFVRNRIWLGGCSGITVGAAPGAGAAAAVESLATGTCAAAAALKVKDKWSQ